MDYLDEMRAWAEDLRLSSSSSSDQDYTIRNDMKKEEEFADDCEEKIEVDVTNPFLTETVFDSRQSLIDWVQETWLNLGFIIVTRSSSSSSLLLQCDRGGTYRRKKTSTKLTGTKKIDCPFILKGLKLREANYWMVKVLCGMHNHAPVSYMEGHPYVGRLSESEVEIMVDMSSNYVKPRDILASLKKRDLNNASTIKTIYNARQKFRTSEKAGKSHIQSLMSFLQEHRYIFYHRTNDVTNELQDLFFAHPGSLELLRAFPHVLLMDATHKTNRFRMPLLEIVGVTPTNMTYCIGFVLLNSEKEDNYTWALRCLQSIIEESIAPKVIVTDRELALMKSCRLVFPNAKKLLCRWHIYRSVLANCKRSFQNKESWDAFYSSWNTLVESKNEIAYVYNLSHLEEMFVSAWTNTYLHFRNLTTNRVESQHAKLKKYLGSSQSDIEFVVSLIHQLVQAQFTSIKASLEKSRHIVQHWFNTVQFRELRGFVSIDALDLIFQESDQSKFVGEDSYACGCKLRTIYRLPCAHELSIYINDSQPIPLASINAFWKKLDLSPCASLRDDDIDCTIEL
ncbi:PKS-NRPS hybrid synthetase CHGG_01239-like [Tripterygium wilfordii]|uniref:PKS-NRPS hybrid synthetase CHGG_01239-like n=1 Tax=Tripterygium wilfordii TaxID=458696 RepID=UPI0018F81DDB|nr:PKS-NRPS hybrid synthetase CHGG_01239-like [Tripterygium wilfordii]